MKDPKAPPVIWFQDSLKPALKQAVELRKKILLVSANLAEAHDKVIADAEREKKLPPRYQPTEGE